VTFRGGRTLTIRTSPHLASAIGVEAIMRHVLLALLPSAVFAVYVFGLSALLVIVVGVFGCIATEVLASSDPHARARDGSAAVTGVLYALTLPPGLPLWMVVVGAVVSIGIGKAIFGGLGTNPFNPALVGRAFMQAAFPAAMTTWSAPLSADRFSSLPSSTLTLPFLSPSYDAVTSATPLAAWKFGGSSTDLGQLMLGLHSGSLGETSSLLLLLGAAYLISRNFMSWRIPAAILLTVAIGSTLRGWLQPEHPTPPAFMLCTGGLMLGALFMATDLVGSPMTSLGHWIFGGLVGSLILIIRFFGGMPEGVMYAILLGNAATPLIDHWIRPGPYGRRAGGSA